MRATRVGSMALLDTIKSFIPKPPIPSKATDALGVLKNAVNPDPPRPADAALLKVMEKAVKHTQPRKPVRDPFSIVSSEMSSLAHNIASLVGPSHPALNKVAMYYFQSEGKHIRPLIVLLLSKALSEIPESQRVRGIIDKSDVEASKPMPAEGIDDPLSPLAILHGLNPDLVLNPLSRPQDAFVSDCDGILPKQRRLAEIVEMIHTASLLHDDVIDNSDVRRNQPSGNVAFSNKMAILAGDFLLGRASVAIARLRNAEVIELLSTTIANLVEGEFMQLKNTAASEASEANRAGFQYYIHKTYLKTASLMSKSCRATAVLAGCDDKTVEQAYMFGRNLGLCFQIVDDMLDYTIAESHLGKPSGADLKLGLATAPVLYAWKDYPELGELIKRQFKQPGDVERARQLVIKANGVERTRELAQHYHDETLKTLSAIPDSVAKQGLIDITHAVLDRSK